MIRILVVDDMMERANYIAVYLTEHGGMDWYVSVARSAWTS